MADYRTRWTQIRHPNWQCPKTGHGQPPDGAIRVPHQAPGPVPPFPRNPHAASGTRRSAGQDPAQCREAAQSRARARGPDPPARLQRAAGPRPASCPGAPTPTRNRTLRHPAPRRHPALRQGRAVRNAPPARPRPARQAGARIGIPGTWGQCGVRSDVVRDQKSAKRGGKRMGGIGESARCRACVIARSRRRRRRSNRVA